MLCRKCGYYADGELVVCPRCGELFSDEGAGRQTGAQAIRQGKRAREAILNPPLKRKQEEERRKKRSGASHAVVPGMTDAEGISHAADQVVYSDEAFEKREQAESGGTYERSYRPLYSDSIADEERARAYAAAHARRSRERQHMVNWVKVGLILTGVLFLLIAGGWTFMTSTEPGQLIMARLHMDAPSWAYLTVGEEKMDRGDVEGAIRDFEKAAAQDKAEGVIDVDGLLLLGNAYEASGRIEEAAALYEKIYTETPSRTEAYVAHIRILQASSRKEDIAKAGSLMKTAYEKTGDITFANQRSDLIPDPPKVDVISGYYEVKKYISITSYQGFDVYYTFDENAELPYGGILFKDRIMLDEGIYTLRAVAKNGELISDELRATYRIIMPSPQTPRSSLAPNTYKSRQRVWLKPGLDNVNDTDIVIYYTIDGSNPDADSPVWKKDEPFWLPGGWVTLKAVAVNKYSKVSNKLEIQYKIDIKPVPLSSYTTEDGPNGFVLYKTTMTEFQGKYGQGELEGNVTLDTLDTECRKYNYPWGYAVMTRVKTGWVVARVYCTSSSDIKAPRNTAVGDTEDYVVGRFRDMGQVASPSGNRGLYFNDKGSGKIWVQEDGGKIIRYRCSSGDGHWWMLEYITNEAGYVTAINMQYMMQ